MKLLENCNMYKKFCIIFSAIILLQGCNDKFISVVSTGNPEIIPEKREIVDVEGYKLENQIETRFSAKDMKVSKNKKKFDFLIEKNELVQYQTKIPEKQKWKKRDGEWAAISAVFGFFSLFSIDGVVNGFEGDNGETEYLGVGTPIVLGIISIASLIPYFGKSYIKTEYKPGKVLRKNEWVSADDERFKISFNQHNKYYSTNNSGQLTINPYDYKFPVLADHQDFQLTFSKEEFQNFGTAIINSSWWMKEYGVINSDPVQFLGKLNSYPSELSGMMGVGSTIYEKQQDYYQLRINNNEAWLKPQFLNIFYYSSQKELNSIPALKLLDYNKPKSEVIEKQTKIINENLN